MKWFKFSIKREIKIVTGLLVVVALIAFSERTQQNVAIQEIRVTLDNIEENHFMDEKNVINLMEVDDESLRGARIASLDLRKLEDRIKHERYVRDAEIFGDLKGNLVVNVDLRRPIARLVRNDGPDGYIADDGTVMPVSDKFTSRVVLISGPFVKQILKQENINATEEGQGLMEMLDMIREDEFWKAQVAQLEIDSKGRVDVYPQVGGEVIEFGKPVELDEKFRKLRIYYKEIMPQKGWNAYKRVNLEFDKQIVAE